MTGRPQQTTTPQEFDHFVADSVDGLLRAAFLIAWDFAEAEDVVQECLFRIARHWPRVRRMEYPTAYARRVLVNLALDEARHRTRHRAELHRSCSLFAGEHEDEAAGRALGWVETRVDLSKALGELAPRQRAALVLRYFDDLSEAQVADVMGCSVGTVKSTISRALQRLRASADPSAVPVTTPLIAETHTENPEGSITR